MKDFIMLFFKKDGFATYSASAGSYLVYVIVGLLFLNGNTMNFDGLRSSLPALSQLDDGTIHTIIMAYMIIGGVMLLIKGVQSLIGTGFLGVPCLLADIAYIALHLFLFQTATTGANMLLVFFLILSGISLIMNIVSLGGRR